jgi:glycosyltransferase involved in cell wall biosynthesis
MSKICFLALFLWLCSSFLPAAGMGINIISQCNGKGLQVDKQILESALRDLGCHINYIDQYQYQTQMAPAADINIFCQKAMPHLFPCARLNWFIPNPEWCYDSQDVLAQFDLILCRTKEVERIFKKMGLKTYFLGFTALDVYEKDVNKDFYSWLHVAGGSAQKGTPVIGDTWMRNPRLPHITIIRHVESSFRELSNFTWIAERVPSKALRELQNRCGVHLCLSETEGFGHYLLEAMSCGAVVVTTAAPPMNEFIRDPRCLVPYNYTLPQLLATNYYVATEDLEKCLKRLLCLPRSELKAIGKSNRIRFLQLQQRFYERLKFLLEGAQARLQ